MTFMNQVLTTNPSQNFFNNLDKNQYAHLLELSTHYMQSTSNTSQSFSNLTSTCLLASLATYKLSNKDKIVDLGASKHICSNTRLFSNPKPITNTTITLPSYSKLIVYHPISVTLHENVVLSNVLYVLNFGFNLLSINSFHENQEYIANFFLDHLTIQLNKQEIMIDKHSKSNGLYILDHKAPNRDNYIDNVSIEVWHRQLGHSSTMKISNLKIHIPCIANKISSCYICPLAKQ